MEQRKIDFMDLTDSRKEWHRTQYAEPYRLVIAFANWLESNGCLNTSEKARILDIGAGGGANIFHLARRFPKSKFTGLELNPELVNLGKEQFKKFNQQNCRLLQGDIYEIDEDFIGKFDGILNTQLLLHLPEFRTPITNLIKLKPKWIAMASLFFDGEINCTIHIQDYTNPLAGNPYGEKNYNIYCLRLVKELFEEEGYTQFKFAPFEIDIDLPKPKTKGMGTYTETLKNGHRLQISGPLLMPWHFVLAKK